MCRTSSSTIVTDTGPATGTTLGPATGALADAAGTEASPAIGGFAGAASGLATKVGTGIDIEAGLAQPVVHGPAAEWVRSNIAWVRPLLPWHDAVPPTSVSKLSLNRVARKRQWVARFHERRQPKKGQPG